MKEKENKTKKQGGDRPQVGSGPSYSDSPSDNVNSSIASSPTDTVRTSKNPAAKIVKNLMPILSIFSEVEYTEYKITQETYNKAPSRVVFDIITAVERALNGEEFEMSAEIAEKMHVGALPGRF